MSWPRGIVRRKPGGCHQRGCRKRAVLDAEGFPRGFCREHLAWRSLQCREHPAEVLRMADYVRDPDTGWLHKVPRDG